MKSDWKTVASKISEGLKPQVGASRQQHRERLLQPEAVGYLHGFGLAIADRLNIEDNQSVGAVLGGYRETFGAELGDEIMRESDKYVMPFDPMDFMMSQGTSMEPNEKHQHPDFLASVLTGTAEGVRFVDDGVRPQTLGRFLQSGVAATSAS